MKQHQQPTDIRRPEREREMDGWTEMRAFRHDDDAYNRRRVYTTTGLRLLRLCAAALRSGLVAGVSNAAAAAAIRCMQQRGSLARPGCVVSHRKNPLGHRDLRHAENSPHSIGSPSVYFESGRVDIPCDGLLLVIKRHVRNSRSHSVFNQGSCCSLVNKDEYIIY